MTRRHRRWRRLLGVALLLPIAGWGPSGHEGTAAAQDDDFPAAARDLREPRLSRLSEAARSWKVRTGSRRQVIDIVCLVPDLPTFYRAISAWDERHYFPVLIEDTEHALRFLRAFRPSRVVRLAADDQPAVDPDPWKAASEAVGRSWSSGREAQAADRPPIGLGATPPGVVISQPDSPTLAGAVALAAGRFQSLVRWEPELPRPKDFLLEAAGRLAAELQARVAATIPNYAGLGDDCDFVTLAGNWPDRFRVPEGEKKGDNAFDDLAGRDLRTMRRWAYVGRLRGSEAESAYDAMCSLFLQPASALLFNAYDEKGEPWAEFQMRDARERLSQLLPTQMIAGPDSANLAGWHRAFDPINVHGLVMINSSGGPNRFNLPNGPGKSADIPMSVPAAVLMTHSFSAARPDDPTTVAGRWRANGAFLYFGSMNEPYLQAFRTPTLLANLLADGLPVGAATRKLIDEDPFGTPWRLHLLGDPLYRLDPEGAKAPRLKRWSPVDGWPAYVEYSPPARNAPAAERLRWALLTAMVHAARIESGPARTAWEAAFLAIPRGSLSEAERKVYDALLADVVTFSRDDKAWRPVVEAIPPGQRQAGPLARSLEAKEALGGGDTASKPAREPAETPDKPKSTRRR